MQQITVFSAKEVRSWLRKHHKKETKLAVVVHKKHTGKPFPTHRALIEEAICFGWIDTTIKRLDDDTFLRHFARRTDKSKWSDNTLAYAKRLVEEGKMSPEGMRFYAMGKARPTHDHGIPKNPDMPVELKRALAKNAKARRVVEAFAPSIKRALFRSILRGKQSATREKSVKKIIASALLSLSIALFFMAPAARAQQSPAPTRTPSPSTAAEDSAVEAGIDLHDHGKYDEAIARYQGVLKQNPDNMNALFELAFSQAAAKDYKTSLDTAAKGTQYKSELLPMFYDVMASALDQMGQPQRAIDTYKRGIELVPDASMLYLNMAVTYMESLKNNEQAILALKKAVTVDPTHPEAQLLLGQLFYSANYRTPALLVFGRYLIMEPAGGRSLQAYGLWRAILRGEAAPAAAAGPPKTDEGEFAALDALIARSHATFSDQMQDGKKETEALVTQLDAILTGLGAGNTSLDGSTFVGRFHAPYFAELQRRNYVEPFVYWVSQRAPVPGVKEWIEVNRDRVREFLNWSAQYAWPKP